MEYLCGFCETPVCRRPSRICASGKVFCSKKCYAESLCIGLSVKDVCDRYKRGETLRVIGTLYGTSDATIRKCLFKYGIPIREASPCIELPVEEVCDRYKRGETIEELGASYGISNGPIRKCLIKHGVSIRGKNDHLWGPKNPTRGKGHSPEAVEKIRAATISQFKSPESRQRASEKQILAMSSGKISKVSKLELLVAQELTLIGIQHTGQAKIRDPQSGKFIACVDFLLGDGRVLEVNGTYWHADPRTYPNGPIFPSQVHTADRYKVKMGKLALLGIPVIEVWETDLKSDPRETVRHAIYG